MSTFPSYRLSMDLKTKRHQMRSLRQSGVPLPASAPCRDTMRRSPGWLKLNSVLLLCVALGFVNDEEVF